jgi:hypothetical protein
MSAAIQRGRESLQHARGVVIVALGTHSAAGARAVARFPAQATIAGISFATR